MGYFPYLGYYSSGIYIHGIILGLLEYGVGRSLEAEPGGLCFRGDFVHFDKN